MDAWSIIKLMGQRKKLITVTVLFWTVLLRIQSKLFIILYNITNSILKMWNLHKYY